MGNIYAPANCVENVAKVLRNTAMPSPLRRKLMLGILEVFRDSFGLFNEARFKAIALSGEKENDL